MLRKERDKVTRQTVNDVLAIVVSHNSEKFIGSALESLLEQTHRVDVVVIDNASTDGTVRSINAAFPSVPVISRPNTGYADATNYALSRTAYEYYFFLNPDAAAPADAVQLFHDAMTADPRIGSLGAAIVDFDDPNTIQEFAPQLDFWLFPVQRLAGKPVTMLPAVLVDAAYAPGAAMFCRAKAFREVGGNDADFFMFSDEADLCWRMLLRGWRTACHPAVRVRHVGGATAAVGEQDGAYVTSARRVFLRERNCLIMGAKNYALWTLCLYLVTNLMISAVEVLALSLMRRREFANAYVAAWRDFFNTFSKTLAKRRAVQASRMTAESRILASRYRGYGKLHALGRVGVPRAVAFNR